MHEPILTFEFASEKDISLIRELSFQVWPHTYSQILSQEQIDYMLEMMYSESALKKQIANGVQFIIVKNNINPIGFASYFSLTSNQFKLDKIYILPSLQGKGIGKKIIDFIIETIKEKGANTLQLQVNRNNAANEFYKKLGFEIIQEADFEIGNGYFMNDFVMEKKI